MTQVVNLGSDSRKLRGCEESEAAKPMKGILMSGTLCRQQCLILRGSPEEPCRARLSLGMDKLPAIVASQLRTQGKRGGASAVLATVSPALISASIN